MIEKDTTNVGSKSFFMIDIMGMFDQTRDVHYILNTEGHTIGIIAKSSRGKSLFNKEQNEKNHSKN